MAGRRVGPPLLRGRGGGISSPIAAPEGDEVAVLVDEAANRVVGIHVYPLLAGAAGAHPDWRRLAEPEPPAEVVAAFVAEVRELFERYWRPAPPIAEQLAGHAREKRAASDLP